MADELRDDADSQDSLQECDCVRPRAVRRVALPAINFSPSELQQLRNGSRPPLQLSRVCENSSGDDGSVDGGEEQKQPSQPHGPQAQDGHELSAEGSPVRHLLELEKGLLQEKDRMDLVVNPAAKVSGVGREDRLDFRLAWSLPDGRYGEFCLRTPG